MAVLYHAATRLIHTTMSEDAKPIDVNDVIAISLDQFAGLAWQKLGLQPDPITGQIAQDLGQAKTAIDLASQLANHLEGSLDEDDRREVHNLIRNLRLNYVEKSKEGQS